MAEKLLVLKFAFLWYTRIPVWLSVEKNSRRVYLCPAFTLCHILLEYFIWEKTMYTAACESSQPSTQLLLELPSLFLLLSEHGYVILLIRRTDPDFFFFLNINSLKILLLISRQRLGCYLCAFFYLNYAELWSKSSFDVHSLYQDLFLLIQSQ